jgi:hypothetical protein
MMRMSPRRLRAYLQAAERVEARTRLHDALTAGFVFLDDKTRRTLRYMWSAVAHDQPVDLATVGIPERRVVSEDELKEWKRKFGGEDRARRLFLPGGPRG